MMENPRAPVVPYDKCPLGYIIYNNIHQDKDDVTLSPTSIKEITIKITTTNEKGIKKSKVITSSIDNDDIDAPNIKNVLSYYNYTDKDIITLYNKTINLLKNNAMDGINELLPLLYYWMHMYNQGDEGNYQFNIHLTCHVGFLLLDCILQSYRGYWNGLPTTLSFHHCITNMNYDDNITPMDMLKKKKKKKEANTEDVEISGRVTINSILEFMEKLINDETASLEENEDYTNELKFRWHLYKSRVVLLQKSIIKNVDKTKYLKKELKSALELYHHKLRVVKDENEDVKSIMNFVTNHRNPILQNQIALYIKANHENESSNNNPKRSLKLCMEARRLANQMLLENASSGKEEQELLEDAIYYNNLGIIHMNSDKIHMAYIYYTKAVSNICSLYNKDDTSNTISNNIPVCEILHNASIVALQAKQYYSAYYYMAKCIQLSPNVFAKRSRCWLRLAEAVIGYYNTKKKGITPSMNKYQLSYNATSTPDYIPRIISYTTNLVQNYDYENEPYLVLSPVLGNDKDMEQLEEIPLLRALFSLRAALRTCPSNDHDCYQTIHLHMAYCHLELNEYISSLHSSNVILANNDDSAIAKRRRITAKLYACESLCYLGKVQQALHLFHATSSTDNNPSLLKPNNTLYQQHAHDLSMFLSNTPEDSKQQRRLKDAMSVIHIASSAIYAFYNNISLTEEYAISSLHSNSKNYHDHLIQQEEERKMSEMTVNDQSSKSNIVPEDIKVVALRNVLYCLFQKQQWEDATVLLHDLLHKENAILNDGCEDGKDEKVDDYQEKK